MQKGLTSVVLERDEFRVAIHNVPALICSACAEAVVDEETAARLLSQAEDSFAQGIREDVHEY
jgi:YgiT-type zinc finger domain-containing protein